MSGQVYQVVEVAGPDKVSRPEAPDRGFRVAARLGQGAVRLPMEGAGAADFRFPVVRVRVEIGLPPEPLVSKAKSGVSLRCLAAHKRIHHGVVHGGSHMSDGVVRASRVNTIRQQHHVHTPFRVDP